MRKILIAIIVIAFTSCGSSKKTITTTTTSARIDSSIMSKRTDEAEVVEIEWNVSDKVFDDKEYNLSQILNKNDTTAKKQKIPVSGHIKITKIKKICSDSANIKKSIRSNARDNNIKKNKQNQDKMLNKTSCYILYIFSGVIIIAFFVKIWLRYKNNIKKFLDIPD